MNMKKITVLMAILLLVVVGASRESIAQQGRMLRFLTALMGGSSAVTFDGNTSLSYRGSLFNQPNSGTKFFMNFWFRSYGPPQGPNQVQINVFTAQGISNQTTGGYVASFSFAEVQDQFIPIFYAGCEDNRSFFGGYSSFKAPFDGHWHVLTVEIVSSVQPMIRFKLDDVEDPAPSWFRNGSQNPNGGVDCNFDWTKVQFWDIAADVTNGTFYLDGDLAQVYVNFGPDAPSVDNSDKFISHNPFGVQARGLGLSCSNPTGNIPQLCLTGNASVFPDGPKIGNNPPSYTFEVNGNLKTAPKPDPCVASWYGLGCAPIF